MSPMPKITVTKPDGTVASDVVVLKHYFGQKPEQSLQDFMAECKALTPEAKQELVTGAAKELGWTVTVS